ncbi:MAG: hypothetical protein IPM24_18575 [Bryobacterales bacterium]|nr:hypothetical protein [Bryobacterales bacterium]
MDSGITKQDLIDVLGPLTQRLQQIEEKQGASFQQIDARFEQIDARFEQIDARFEQIDARFEQIDARFEQIERRIDAVVESVLGEFAQLRREIDARFQSVEHRLELHSNQLERLNSTVAAIQMQMSAFTKATETAEKAYAQLRGDVDAQKRYVDDLARRIAALEERKAS